MRILKLLTRRRRAEPALGATKVRKFTIVELRSVIGGTNGSPMGVTEDGGEAPWHRQFLG